MLKFKEQSAERSEMRMEVPGNHPECLQSDSSFPRLTTARGDDHTSHQGSFRRMGARCGYCTGIPLWLWSRILPSGERTWTGKLSGHSQYHLYMEQCLGSLGCQKQRETTALPRQEWLGARICSSGEKCANSSSDREAVA